jgi:energy-coupling factor transport system permease protein
MKIEDNQYWGYVEGTTALHRLRPEIKIVAALLLIAASGIGNGWALALAGILSALGVMLVAVPLINILRILRRMAWFFMAIAIFPVLFTSGFYIELPTWFPISISREGLTLALESCVRLINVLLISLVMVRTTPNAEWMEGLEKLLGPRVLRLPYIRDLFAVGLLSVKFLPMILADTEEHFANLRKQEIRGYQKLSAVVQSVLQFIVEIFSDVDRYQRPVGSPAKETD